MSQSASLLEKYCKVENNALFRLRQKEVLFGNALVCSNFEINESHFDTLRINNDVTLVPESELVIFRNCKLHGFNDMIASKIHNIFRLSLENCVITLRDSDKIYGSSLFSLHIFNSTIHNNKNSSSISELKNLHNFYAIDSKFDPPEIEYSYFNSNTFYRIVFSNCNLLRMFNSCPNQFIYLEVDGNNLTEAISYTPGLIESYNFANNQLSRLPSSLNIFQQDATLKKLNVSNNKIVLDVITQRHFQSLVNLEILDLSRNSKIMLIATEAFKSCSYLRLLNISNCSLESISNLGSRSFETLDFSQNLLKEIPETVFQNLPKLKELKLNENSLTYFSNHSIKELMFLNLSHNLLTTFDCGSNLENLEIIDLSFNKLTDVQDIWSLKKVSEIYLQSNKLKFIFCGNHLSNSLKILDISNNNILSYTSDIFSKLEVFRLKNTRVGIQFSENFDSQISIDIQKFLEHSCSENETALVCQDFQMNEADLTYFSITQHELTSKKSVIFQNCEIQVFNAMLISILPKTSELYLKKCKVEMKNFKGSTRIANQLQLEVLVLENSTILFEYDFEILNKFPNLKTFRVIASRWNNQFLGEKMFYENHNLEEITIENTNLREINLKAMKLKHLNLKGNQLQKPGFLGPNKLSTLDLSMNQITSLPSSLDALSGQSQLIELNLSGNTISESELSKYHFKDLTNLQRLDLNNNTEIKFLGHEVFIYLQNLKYVDLSLTGLKALDTMGATNLETADFSFNFIEFISISDFIGLKNLLNLKLNHNCLKSLSKNVFKDLTSLESLSLSNNQIQVLNANDFNGLQRLHILDLSFNVIEEIPNMRSIKSLNFLYLQINHLVVIPCIQQLPQSLEIIDISHNYLEILKKNNVLHLKVHVPYELELNTTCPWSQKVQKSMKLKSRVSKCCVSLYLLMFCITLRFIAM